MVARAEVARADRERVVVARVVKVKKRQAAREERGGRRQGCGGAGGGDGGSGLGDGRGGLGGGEGGGGERVVEDSAVARAAVV